MNSENAYVRVTAVYMCASRDRITGDFGGKCSQYVHFTYFTNDFFCIGSDSGMAILYLALA